MAPLLPWLVVIVALSSPSGFVHGAAITSEDHGAAIPSEDTLVVVASERTPTPPLPENAIVTEESLIPIKVLEMDVQSNVYLRYAKVEVMTRVRNPAKRAQETTFRVLLPETGFISGFVMTLDGKPYKAYVKEKEEAKKIYTDAVSQGISAAHIATKARDSNHFTVSVNVEPNTEAMFNLTYEELLFLRKGLYSHNINLHPGTLVPKLQVKVHIKENEKLTKLKVPPIKTGNEIDTNENDEGNNPLANIQRDHDDREATITFAPNLEEQKKLMEIYFSKSKESQDRNIHDDKDKDGVIGQFVVEYDVNRPEGGEIIVNDGYFVHFFAPTSLPPLNKHIVFVLDTSGSMYFRKINQLRDAMKSILDDLNEGDYFNLVEFSSNAYVHELSEANQDKKEVFDIYSEDKGVALKPPNPATKENIAKAKVIVDRMGADGGTNIDLALNVAVSLIKKGINWKASNKTLLKTGDIESSTKTEATQLPETTTLSENKNEKSLEPIIIFLTDGDATVGETNTRIILNRLSERNFGENKATIFSLAFGEDADRDFLRTISLRNDGFMRHIYEASDAALQIHDFYKQVSSPLLSNVKFTYPPEQIQNASTTKMMFRTYYRGSESVVAGRLADSVQELDVDIQALCQGDDANVRRKYQVKRKVPVPKTKNEYLPLERLWAYMTIKQLLDKKETDDPDTVYPVKEEAPEKKALALALKYEFVTPLTSLVVVKPNSTNTVDAESVDNIPEVLPQPISYQHSYAFMAPDGLYSNLLSFRSDFGSVPWNTAKRGRVNPVKLQRLSDTSFASSASDDIILEEAEIDEPDYGNIHTSSQLHPSPVIKDHPVNQTTEQATTESSNADEKYHWMMPIIDQNNNQLSFLVNGTTVTLKLANERIQDSHPCSPSLDSTDGRCIYLTQCEAARNITVELYSSHYCTVSNGYAGVCCPQQKLKPQEMTIRLPK